MDKLFQRSDALIRSITTDYIRDHAQRINWDWRLTGVIGARGVGKTTLLLQQLKMLNLPSESVYITLDDIWFTENRLIDFIETFHQRGGKLIFLDEVHKYPNWARELKNAYDYFSELKIVFTGSSIIEILAQEVDLSRRAILHTLPGLSFREYLKMGEGPDLPVIPLEDLLDNHRQMALDLIQEFKPLKHFGAYLKQGYYPFVFEGTEVYHQRLDSMVRLIVESDLQFIPGYDPKMRRKVYQLLHIIAQSSPFKPNISKLSQKIDVARISLTQYLDYLRRARLINTLNATGSSTSALQKPDKIYLENSNIAYALTPESSNIGSARETFFFNQLHNAGHALSLPKRGDFLIDEQFTIEVGGAGKGAKQISGLTNAFIAADDIETGIENKVPLWMFGLLY